MSLKPKAMGSIPEMTCRIGQQILKPENVYRQMGEKYADVVRDEDFVKMYSHLGQPAISPARLAMVVVMQAMEGVSDRVAAEMVRTRIDWKYALHLELEDHGFDASVLSEFRQRIVSQEAERKVFDAFVNRFQEEGLLKGRGLQRTDSLGVVAAVRELNRLELVMETMRKALEGVVEANQEWGRGVVSARWIETYETWTQGERVVKGSGPEAKSETLRRLEAVGRDGYQLLEMIEAEGTPKAVREARGVEILKQVWSQQYRLVNAPGVTRIELSTVASRAQDGVSELIQTPHDVEARYRIKRGVGQTGYTLQITEVAGEAAPAIITDVAIEAGNADDTKAVAAIHQRLTERGLTPTTHLVDSGYLSGNILVESAQRGVELLGPLQDDSSPAAQAGLGFGLEHFDLSFETRTAICPGGQPAARWTPFEDVTRKRELIQIAWTAATCGRCEFRAVCVSGQTGRFLKVSHRFPTIKARRQYQKTPEFRQRYRRRAGIEATFSTMVNTCGARRTPYRGRHKTLVKYAALATAINLRRAIAWKTGVSPQRHRRSRLRHLLGIPQVNQSSQPEESAR